MFEAPILDPVRFTTLEEVVEGRVPVRDLERLQSVLHSTGGEIRYRVSGSQTPEGHPALSLHVEGALDLTCQRCMAGMPFDLAVDSRIVMFKDEEALPDLEEEVEGTDAIVQPEKLNIAELVEDEVLLSLPLVPSHPDGACRADGETEAALAKEHPFASLQKLKQST
ncbi:MAG: DUF177 domain-containing protein [Betaproteobacteria bacterium]|nr:DUF177 domain-containing protein [Betaproteobacteria bacterium]MDE2622219.1 DUF177 domain-containing protein [Betaproteobacteria bacterium]